METMLILIFNLIFRSSPFDKDIEFQKFLGLKYYYNKDYLNSKSCFEKILPYLSIEEKVIFINSFAKNASKEEISLELEKILDGSNYFSKVEFDELDSVIISQSNTTNLINKNNDSYLNKFADISYLKELIKRYEQDQFNRKKLIGYYWKKFGLNSDSTNQFNSIVMSADNENILFVRKLINKIDSIDEKQISSIGLISIFSIVQHSLDNKDRDLLYSKIINKKKLTSTERMISMFLIDRINVDRRQKQIYGTQFKISNDALEPEDIVSLDEADKARLSINLLTVEHQKIIINLLYGFPQAQILKK